MSNNWGSDNTQKIKNNLPNSVWKRRQNMDIQPRKIKKIDPVSLIPKIIVPEGSGIRHRTNSYDATLESFPSLNNSPGSLSHQIYIQKNELWANKNIQDFKQKENTNELIFEKYNEGSLDDEDNKQIINYFGDIQPYKHNRINFFVRDYENIIMDIYRIYILSFCNKHYLIPPSFSSFVDFCYKYTV
jgi:hypothetical protein